MKSYWIRGGPKPNDECLYKSERDVDTDTEETQGKKLDDGGRG